MAPEAAPPTIARSAASAGVATLTSRILGVVREMVLARYFGTSEAMDAFRVAFRVPNLLRDLFAEGAMSAAFVPTFTQRLTTLGKPEALRLGTYVTNALLLITLALVVIGLLFTEPLVRLLVKDEYAADAERLQLTVMLARVMLPFFTFIALAAVAMGMLNALRHFFVPALSSAMFNAVSIVAVITLVPVMVWFGVPPITAAAIGIVGGGFAQWAMQWPLLRREGFRYRPELNPRDEGLRRVLMLMGPGTIGLAATQINIVVNTTLATGEQVGAVSALEYAFRLMYLPIGLFGVSVATATTPVVARFAAERDHPAIRRTVADSVALMLSLNVPATVGLFVLAVPIVRVMYEGGEFTPAATLATAAALQGYAIGLLGYSVVRIASPVFYALGEARTPVKVSVATVAVNAGLNVMLVRIIGFEGLAIGTSIAALFNASTLLILLSRRLDGIDAPRIGRTLARISFAAGVMGLAAYGLNRYLPFVIGGTGIVVDATRLVLTIAGASAVLAAAAHLLGIEEFERASSGVLRRLRRSRR